jgi:hypothetical protein
MGKNNKPIITGKRCIPAPLSLIVQFYFTHCKFQNPVGAGQRSDEQALGKSQIGLKSGLGLYPLLSKYYKIKLADEILII